MSIDDLTKISQIIFYSVMAAVAVLTYLKAKNTLLNSVNTEYHKHVIDALVKASNNLYSEFEEGNKNHWAKGNRIKEVIDEVNKEFLAWKSSTDLEEEFYCGVMVSDLEMRLTELNRQYKSDPFIPEEIRNKIIDLLQNRLHVHQEITFEVVNDYIEGLSKGKNADRLEENYAWISNKINSQLYERGCGISQVEDAVHEIRLEIKNYLEQFNPLKNA